MNSDNLTINSNVTIDFDNMDKEIKMIENVLQDTYGEMMKLDETVWKTKEKEKIDQTFMPYLKKFMESYPNYLRVRVQFARDAVNAHKTLDIENAKLTNINE